MRLPRALAQGCCRYSMQGKDRIQRAVGISAPPAPILMEVAPRTPTSLGASFGLSPSPAFDHQAEMSGRQRTRAA